MFFILFILLFLSFVSVVQGNTVKRT